MQLIISADGRVSLSKNGTAMGTIKFDDMAQAKETFSTLEALF